MTALCAGRDPEWWTPGHEQARLAIRICTVCPGCPDNDPAPHGVIRRGVAYNDRGFIIPPCPNCGHPQVNYRGGDLTLCSRCAVPDVPIPSCRGSRPDQVRTLVGQGRSDAQIGFDLGVKAEHVRKLRQHHEIYRTARNQPIPA